MALLNLDKKKADAKKEEPASDEKVPDELPSLPESEDDKGKEGAEEEKKEENKGEEKKDAGEKEGGDKSAEATEELPEVKEEDVENAKDTGTMEDKGTIEIEEPTPASPEIEHKEETVEVKQEVKQPAQPADDSQSKNLFFSELIHLLDTDKDPDKIKSKLLSEHIVDEMKKHFKEEKVNAEIDTLNQEIKEKAMPLKSMEVQWQKLNRDINQKQKELRDLEKDIENKTEELKSLILKYSKMKKKAHEEQE